jgi:predicted esterase
LVKGLAAERAANRSRIRLWHYRGMSPTTPARRRARRAAAGLCALGASLGVLAADTPATAVGSQPNVVLTDYSPLAANSEMVRRLSSPLVAAQFQQTLAHSGKQLIEQSIDLAQERFALYVPARAPPHGYALLVFVMPWQEAILPRGWAAVLDQYGVIFISAARSGNDEDVFGRRVPLALLAAHNLMQRYTIDKERVYIGGFSGGARTALRLALAYPDLFRGALLTSSSDPIGTESFPLPATPLFSRFQEATRLVYVTGEHDWVNLALASGSLRSMRAWCVYDLESQTVAGAGHELANRAALSRALQALGSHVARDADKLAACRAELEHNLNTQLAQVAARIAEGQPAAARKLLMEVDRRFGGLAAPRSLELQSQLQ